MFRRVLTRTGLWFFGTTFVVWAFGEHLGVIQDEQPLFEQLVVPVVVGVFVGVCAAFWARFNSNDTR